MSSPGRFRFAAGILRAVEEVAARHPVLRIQLAEHDRIKESPFRCVEPDDTAAALFEIGQYDPGFQRLFMDVAVERDCPHGRTNAIQNQSSVANHRAAEQLTVLLPNAIARVTLEAPTRIGGGERTVA